MKKDALYGFMVIMGVLALVALCIHISGQAKPSSITEAAERKNHARLEVLAREAPEVLQEPEREAFTCLRAYEQAMARFNFRGDWATYEGEISNPCH